MTLRFLSLFCVTLSLTSATGLGAEPTYAGSGCPNGSVRLVERGNAFDIELSEFRLEASRPVARTNCSLRFPVNVPAGQKLQLKGGKYHGESSIQGGAVTLHAEHFLVGKQGAHLEKEVSSRFTASMERTGEAGNCGQSPIVSLNISLRATGETTGGSATLKAVRGVELSYQPCN